VKEPAPGVQFTKDGRTLLSTGSDGSTRLYDTATHREIGNPFPGQDQQWGYGVFTGDESSVVVIHADGTGYIWPASLASWENHACAVAKRSLTPAEWLQFVGGGYPHPRLCG
jgi:WD40 repeat protein